MHKIRELYNRPAAQGFTLIEMAIVLVVIGLILGMVFKGRQLIASAKVKNANAGYNKVIAGMNTFYDRYGFYPGDGCEQVNATEISECEDTRDGLINDVDAEETSFFSLMQAKNILTKADTESALGDRWQVGGNGDDSWIYVETADARIVCDLDRVADDGVSGAGDIRADDSVDSSTWTNSNGTYEAGEDCWDLTGTTGVQLKILP